jgi:hypothetical protein
MFKQIPYEDPADVRRLLQTRYDDYRAKRRLRLGIMLPGVHVNTMGSTLEERNAAYAELADRYPKRSRELIINVARESLFDQACLVAHEQLLGNFQPEDMQEDTRAVIASGLGRNAVIFSTVNSRGLEYRTIAPSRAGIPDSINQLSIDLLVFDPDQGMGLEIDEPTPELCAVILEPQAA